MKLVVSEETRVEPDVQPARLAIRLREGRVPKGTKVQDAAQVLAVVLNVFLERQSSLILLN